MKKVSNSIKKSISKNKPALCYADVIFQTGKKVTLGPEDDFMADGNGFSQQPGNKGFALGCAIAKVITLNIDNMDDRYSSHDFDNAKIILYTGIENDQGTIEKIKEGKYTVVDSVTPGEVLEIEAVDEMYKADTAYIPNITTPASMMDILKDVCDQCKIQLGISSFKNQNYMIDAIPLDVLCRSVIGYIAQIAGGNAYIDSESKLIIRSFDKKEFDCVEISENNFFDPEYELDGGQFSDKTSNTIDGSTFNNIPSDFIDGGNFSDHNLHDWSDLTVSTDDVIITGVSTIIVTKDGEAEKEESYLYGKEGYVINIDNPFIAGNEKSIVDQIGKQIVGLKFRPFDGSYIGFTLLEFMDTCVVWDKKKNYYISFITDIDINYPDNCSISNKSEPALENQSNYTSGSSEVYRKTKEELRKNSENFKQALEKASGLYKTDVAQDDGSVITYYHDKQNLEDSQIQMVFNTAGFGITSDGGRNWYGLQVNGDFIANILNAIGVNADWVTIGGTANQNGILKVKDSNGNVIVRLDKDGVFAKGAYICESTDGKRRVELYDGEAVFTDGAGEIAGRVQTFNNGESNGLIIEDKNGSKSIAIIDNFIRLYSEYLHLYSDHMTIDTIESIGGKPTKSGRAEFSDGSYLEFSNGLLVGGRTANGTEI